MSVGRDPVDRVLDLLVFAPIGVAIVARDAVPLAGTVAKRIMHDVATQVGRQVRPESAAERDTTTMSPDPASGGADHVAAPRVEGSGTANPAADESTGPVNPASGPLLAIDDYDHLAARQVVDRLASLTPEELDAIETYERAHRHRRTVLGKIEQLQP